MEPNYNTVVRFGNEIIGKTTLSALLSESEELPKEWKIYYKAENVTDKLVDPEEKDSYLFNSSVPLHINIGHDESSLNKDRDTDVPSQISIFIRGLDSNAWNITVNPNQLVEDFKSEVYNLTGIPVHSQHLLFGGCFLKNDRTLWDQGVRTYATIQVLVSLKGGGPSGLRTVNVEGSQERGVALEATTSWEGFNTGLNLYGRCPNPLCLSKTTSASPDIPRDLVQKLYYGIVRLTPTKNKFPCPACHPNVYWKDEAEFMFTQTNFLVSHGRALFRFRKDGAPENEIRSVVLESYGRQGEYVMFSENGDNEEYEFLEIISVEPKQSVYACVGCAKMIYDRKDEKILGCGHVFHDRCLENSHCRICNAPKISGKKLFSFANDKKPGLLQGGGDSWTSVKCSRAMKSKEVIDTPENSDAVNADRKRHIRSNLDKLVENTVVNSHLFAILRSKNLFSESDIQDVQKEATPYDQSYKLYNLFLTKIDHYLELFDKRWIC